MRQNFSPLFDVPIAIADADKPFGTFVFTARTKVQGITAIRLEALSDPSLVKGGPGRAANANFALSDIRPLRMFGLGMATAVFVDATLVRMVLVPSVMQLLGRTAWTMPRWLDRLLPDSRLDETAVVEPSAA